ncbi:MAG: CoA pyrophosphatase [Betaproteobacteria bacterium]|nr:CoA pyrophosphatase [Betaproteobacteria bacterium]
MTAFDGAGVGAAPAAAESPVNVPIEPDALAERLARAHVIVQAFEHDLWHQQRIPPGQKVKHAAVLMPLVQRSAGTQVLFTQRTSHLHDHAGQISFPGGRVEPEDRNREDTALRETEEEIGLPRAAIRVLGALPDHEMQSGFCITPVVGWIRPPYRTEPDRFEVQDIFEAPLAHFLSPGHYQRRRYVVEGLDRRYLAIPYGGRYIWGATAAILYSFYQLLRAS